MNYKIHTKNYIKNINHNYKNLERLKVNEVPINKEYNANLFYHSWVFDSEEYDNVIITNVNKNPFVGIFYPSGSIYTLNTAGIVPYNDFYRFSNNIHFNPVCLAEIMFSPANAFIYIDINKPGKFYSVCVNDEVYNKKGVIRGRVDLVLYIPNLKIYKNYAPNTSIYMFFKDLLSNPNFYYLLNTSELQKMLLHKYSNNILYPDLKFNISLDCLTLFKYSSTLATRSYPITHAYTLPINCEDIPYIEDIKPKLNGKLTSEQISKIKWEFGIYIVSKLR